VVSRTTAISDERDCERLVLDFVHFSDRQEYESLAALFVPDGCLSRPTGDPLVGRDAILKSYQSRPAGRITRHICTNIRITMESAERARGFSYALVYSWTADNPADVKVGEFEDEFVRTPEGWRFASRDARFVMHT
jgi:hypothetical protein